MRTKIRGFKLSFYLKWLLGLLVVAGFFYAGHVFAQDTTTTLGSVASHVTQSFGNIGKLMFATAYLAGFGFVIAAIFKFKQHKDNPTQIPMGTPLAMLVIGVILIFLPSIVGPAGSTVFEKATPGGFTGKGVSQIPGASDAGTTKAG